MELFGLIFFVVGIAGIMSTLFQLIKMLIEIKLKVKTQGEVIKSEIKIFYLREQRPEEALASIAKKVDVRYQYFVNDKMYESQKITNKEIFIFNKTNYLKKYPISKKIDVFYDPHNPKDSVLELDTNFEAKLLIILVCSGLIYGGIQYL